MTRFIRLDMKGHWKGTEHCSTFADDPEFWGDETDWEDGISCYKLDGDQAYALENLRYYWMDIVRKRSVEDYKNMQVTIFEGIKVGEGSELEDLAECTKTISESEATELMSLIMDAYDKLQEGDIEEDEYENILNAIQL